MVRTDGMVGWGAWDEMASREWWRVRTGVYFFITVGAFTSHAMTGAADESWALVVVGSPLEAVNGMVRRRGPVGRPTPFCCIPAPTSSQAGKCT